MSQTRTPQTIPHVIAVTSGKGGVGKSSVAVNLALVLARQGLRVNLLDADAGMANANILLGLKVDRHLEHVILAGQRIDDVRLQAPYGLQVIPGASGVVACAQLSERHQLHLARELSRLDNNSDLLLIDTAAGIGQSNLNFIRAAHHALIVITTEPTSLTDAFSLIKVLRRQGKRHHFPVLVNMCDSIRQGREIYTRFAGAVRQYIGVNTDFCGCIMRDESLRAAVTMQTPVALFAETDPSYQHFRRLADAVLDYLPSEPPRTRFSTRLLRCVQRDQQTRSSEQNNAAPASRANSVADNSFAALQTRLLTLIAQGDVSVDDIRGLRMELDKALQRQAPHKIDPRQAPAFDQQRFGSQHELLNRLRSHREQSLQDLLKTGKD